MTSGYPLPALNIMPSKKKKNSSWRERINKMRHSAVAAGLFGRNKQLKESQYLPTLITASFQHLILWRSFLNIRRSFTTILEKSTGIAWRNMKPVDRDQADRKAVTLVLTGEGGKYYAVVLESHHHFLHNYRRHRLREFVLLSEMDAVWLSTAKEDWWLKSLTDRCKAGDTMDSLVVLSFLLRAEEGVPWWKPACYQSCRHFHEPSVQAPSPKKLSTLKVNIQLEAPRILSIELGLLAAVPSFESSQF